MCHLRLLCHLCLLCLLCTLGQRRAQAFGQLFLDLDCPLSKTDVAAYVCTDVVMLIDLICCLSQRDPSHLSRIKLGGDGGRGSLKMSLQLLFDDDPLLIADSQDASSSSSSSTISVFKALVSAAHSCYVSYVALTNPTVLFATCSTNSA